MTKKIIVIGAGFGGMAAAIRLAARGYQVEIYEKRDKPGGRGYLYEMDGFKFDGGPTVITAPFMFDDIFAAAGKKSESYVEFLPVDPFYRIFDADKRVFNYNNQSDFIYSQIENGILQMSAATSVFLNQPNRFSRKASCSSRISLSRMLVICCG